MNALQLAWKNIVHRPLQALLVVLLSALGVFVLSLVLVLGHQVSGHLERNAGKVGLVVGAKGSPLQIILCNLFHIDFPTGNIPLKEAAPLAKNPFVKQAIPLALGDSYKGSRIVGTTPEYLSLYGLELSQGKTWDKNLQIVAGAEAAQRIGLKLGSVFQGQHGLVAGGETHAHGDYKVVGILKPSGTVADQLLLTSVPSVWMMHHEEEQDKMLDPEEAAAHEDGDQHEHNEEEGHHHEEGDDEHDHGQDEEEGHDHEHHDKEHGEHEEHDHDDEKHMHHKDGHEHDHEHHEHDHTCEHEHPEHQHDLHGSLEELFAHHPEQEITSLLINFKNPMGALTLPRMINTNTSMQAAAPAMQINRLYSLFQPAQQVLYYAALGLGLVALLSIFVSLYYNLVEHRAELAVLRSLGASRTFMASTLLSEGVLLATLGGLMGLALPHALLYVLKGQLEPESAAMLLPFKFYAEEFYVLLAMPIMGFLASLLPAYQAFKIEVSKALKA